MNTRLSFSNRWMFNRVMCQQDVCRQVLRAVLGIDVGSISYLNAEQVVEPTLSGRGIRMDVYARDEGHAYDVEMQVEREGCLGKRMRYYQAAIDTSELGAGGAFGNLPDSYVIFLCCYDAYGKGEPIYRIERACAKHPDVDIEDGSPWVVLNATAWERADSEPLRDLLRYALTDDAEGSLSQEIDVYVAEYNRDREWVSRVMTFEQNTEYRCRMAMQQGIERGESRSFALIQKLLEAGRLEEALRASQDATYRNELFLEFGL